MWGIALSLTVSLVTAAGAQDEADDATLFRPRDVFELEYASDPQISPDGERVVYVRNFFDVMTDRRRSNLWSIGFDGGDHRPLTTGNENDSSPRWSPDGKRLLYVSSLDGTTQLYVRWMDTGQTARITQLTESPGGMAWSPDGTQIAFTMLVPDSPAPMIEMPKAPEGAEWAPPARVIDDVVYRADGAGMLEAGFTHVFVVPAEGGTPRQLTTGNFHHRDTPSWGRDGKILYLSANRHRDWEHVGRNSEVYALDVASGHLTAMSDRFGPDRSPVVAPDGQAIALLGYDDHVQGYQVTKLYTRSLDEGGAWKCVTDSLDRSVSSPRWARQAMARAGLYFQYADQGNTKLGFLPRGRTEIEVLAHDLGGTSLGRPYGGGSFSVDDDTRFAFTMGRPDFPADVAVGERGVAGTRRITHLNDDLLGHKTLGVVEERWWESSCDGRRIQGWVIKPPHFDPARKYPLVLEIHGGPFADYGDRFTAEGQLYAAAGYVVLYCNPRGSSSYGEEFGNLIHHAYPGNDYDDLMSGVDAVLAEGYVDATQLFVTGGSGGGVLTAWIVGKTDRFRAAVVAKPVINWTSFVLTSDSTNFYWRYWFPGYPWDFPEHYHARSPLSLVGNVTTPTMLLSGDEDWRTPIGEAEQYYTALRLRGVDTALVRFPGASHGIASRPSRMISKVLHVLAWFARCRTDGE